MFFLFKHDEGPETVNTIDARQAGFSCFSCAAGPWTRIANIREELQVHEAIAGIAGIADIAVIGKAKPHR